MIVPRARADTVPIVGMIGGPVPNSLWEESIETTLAGSVNVLVPLTPVAGSGAIVGDRDRYILGDDEFGVVLLRPDQNAAIALRIGRDALRRHLLARQQATGLSGADIVQPGEFGVVQLRA